MGDCGEKGVSKLGGSIKMWFFGGRKNSLMGVNGRNSTLANDPSGWPSLLSILSLLSQFILHKSPLTNLCYEQWRQRHRRQWQQRQRRRQQQRQQRQQQFNSFCTTPLSKCPITIKPTTTETTTTSSRFTQFCTFLISAKNQKRPDTLCRQLIQTRSTLRFWARSTMGCTTAVWKRLKNAVIAKCNCNNM